MVVMKICVVFIRMMHELSSWVRRQLFKKNTVALNYGSGRTV